MCYLMAQTENIYNNVIILDYFWSKLRHLTSWAPIYRAALSCYATGIGDTATAIFTAYHLQGEIR